MNKPATLLHIVEDSLKANGFDGLHNDFGDCACLVGDLMPCGQPGTECVSGYKTKCDCGEHDFHIVMVRPTPEQG